MSDTTVTPKVQVEAEKPVSPDTTSGPAARRLVPSAFSKGKAKAIPDLPEIEPGPENWADEALPGKPANIGSDGSSCTSVKSLKHKDLPNGNGWANFPRLNSGWPTEGRPKNGVLVFKPARWGTREGGERFRRSPAIFIRAVDLTRPMVDQYVDKAWISVGRVCLPEFDLPFRTTGSTLPFALAYDNDAEVYPDVPLWSTKEVSAQRAAVEAMIDYICAQMQNGAEGYWVDAWKKMQGLSHSAWRVPPQCLPPMMRLVRKLRDRWFNDEPNRFRGLLWTIGDLCMETVHFHEGANAYVARVKKTLVKEYGEDGAQNLIEDYRARAYANTRQPKPSRLREGKSFKQAAVWVTKEVKSAVADAYNAAAIAPPQTRRSAAFKAAKMRFSTAVEQMPSLVDAAERVADTAKSVKAVSRKVTTQAKATAIQFGKTSADRVKAASEKTKAFFDRGLVAKLKSYASQSAAARAVRWARGKFTDALRAREWRLRRAIRKGINAGNRSAKLIDSTISLVVTPFMAPFFAHAEHKFTRSTWSDKIFKPLELVVTPMVDMVDWLLGSQGLSDLKKNRFTLVGGRKPARTQPSLWERLQEWRNGDYAEGAILSDGVTIGTYVTREPRSLASAILGTSLWQDDAMEEPEANPYSVLGPNGGLTMMIANDPSTRDHIHESMDRFIMQPMKDYFGDLVDFPGDDELSDKSSDAGGGDEAEAAGKVTINQPVLCEAGTSTGGKLKVVPDALTAKIAALKLPAPSGAIVDKPIPGLDKQGVPNPQIPAVPKRAPSPVLLASDRKILTESLPPAKARTAEDLTDAERAAPKPAGGRGARFRTPSADAKYKAIAMRLADI